MVNWTRSWLGSRPTFQTGRAGSSKVKGGMAWTSGFICAVVDSVLTVVLECLYLLSLLKTTLLLLIVIMPNISECQACAKYLKCFMYMVFILRSVP
jgi:hypothetical protein